MQPTPTPTPTPLPGSGATDRMLDAFIGPNWLDAFLLTAGTGMFFAAALIELAFLVHYIRVAPAFKSWIGWMFVLRSVSFLMSGAAILLGRILGPNYALRPYVTFALFLSVLISALVTYGTFLYERYRHDTPHGHSSPIAFARRAIGLRARGRTERQDASEPRPTTRPLRIVKDAP